jgi:ATP-dependent DNA ligase
MLFEYAPEGKTFSGDEWIMEVKEDGIRIVAIKEGAVRLYTRGGNDVSAKFPEVVEALQGHPDGVYDGEITIKPSSNPGATTASGRANMKPGSARLFRYTQPATYHVFDLTRLGDADLRDTPLVERKQLLAGVPRNDRVVVVEYRDAVNVDEFFQAVVTAGGEGIVLKQKQSRYHRSGLTCGSK